MAAPMRRSTLNYLVSNCGIGPRVCKLPLVAAHRSHIHHVAKQSETFKSVYFGCNKQSTCSAIFNLRKLYSHSHSNALLLARSKQQVYFFARYFSKHAKTAAEKHSERTTMIYVAAIGVFMIGMSYAGVPLYRMFCQQTGLGGQAVKGHDVSKVENMTPVKERKIRVRFNADTASSMQWNFKPQQSEITVLPGETALAFYTAKNPTDKPIIGISTYNVVPFDAGQYFNKIQCFCFEEQWLNPREQVDMPVFFYIDPEFADDPKLELVDTITLSYTFFEAKEGMNLPLPGYMQAQ